MYSSFTRKKVLLFVLGIFLVLTACSKYSEDHVMMYSTFAIYYGALGILLSCGWGWLSRSIDMLDNSDNQHKSEEGG